ncbi:MAG: ABC transporter ATP-binding protein [Acidiferrobacteraceae bacterium]|jgi:spermidine/putrescine transport system ATP-binding protein|nr:ABC transporter ATP-binding protein [Acidiferrobacteraceae bacterium]MDP6551042.1 ABC transporter ATP-binding protein [Arenicellales bacterium]MDP6791847.1 ABC transporter ATP-binding protein [Arenicellales bacterium]MDP6918299.1 ABC transporter ATP-binding protein [Arenicellales bacterium]|tara:strand:+ start:20812 stop:21918 length:1107 start_codon:yes stop_codon:yes gene_type:complete
MNQTSAARPLVSFDGVSKHYGSVVAVHTMNLEIYEGEFLALMGPSGCGKTTSLRMLAGLEEPSEGEIRLDGQRINEISSIERDTPMVWQSLALFPFLSVQKNVEFGLKMRAIAVEERRQRARKWLERMEILELAERDISQLSGGQRQRVALARSLVTEPRILLLDEPLTALDANLVVRMQGVLARLQKELGITFVYVTHSQSEAFAMSDRVVIMSQGRIEQIGSPKAIYRSPASRFVADFVGANNILSGSITETGEDLKISTAVGEFHCEKNSDRDFNTGDTLDLVISADLVQISMEGPEVQNSLRCRFISEEFVGSIVTIFAELEDGSDFKVQARQRDLANMALEEGAAFFASWNAADAHLIGGNGA